MRGGGHKSEWNSEVGHEEKKVENHSVMSNMTCTLNTDVHFLV
jgi:hypothetical protein